MNDIPPGAPKLSELAVQIGPSHSRTRRSLPTRLPVPVLSLSHAGGDFRNVHPPSKVMVEHHRKGARLHRLGELLEDVLPKLGSRHRPGLRCREDGTDPALVRHSASSLLAVDPDATDVPLPGLRILAGLTRGRSAGARSWCRRAAERDDNVRAFLSRAEPAGRAVPGHSARPPRRGGSVREQVGPVLGPGLGAWLEKMGLGRHVASECGLRHPLCHRRCHVPEHPSVAGGRRRISVHGPPCCRDMVRPQALASTETARA